MAHPGSPQTTPQLHKLCIYGLAAEITSSVPSLEDELYHLFRPFLAGQLPTTVAAVRGSIEPYVEKDVLRHVSAAARRVSQVDPWLELYQDGERFWLVDERWGMAEVNLLRGHWRSWVLEQVSVDAVRLAEGAVLWPLAQLLRSRGIHLLPAASITFNGWGALLLSSFSVAAELGFLVRSGYRLVGQRWSALRSVHGDVELLHFPGKVERGSTPRLRSAPTLAASHWLDLGAEHPGCSAGRASCELVLIAEPGRRSDARITELSGAEAQEALRHDWPLVDLHHPARRNAQLPGQMAQVCRCVQVQFSRDLEDLPVLFDYLRSTTRGEVPRMVVLSRQRRQMMPATSTAA